MHYEFNLVKSVVLGSCRDSIRRRHGYIMLALARDMRQKRAFESRAADA
jgi:hypothetical protein